MSISVNIPEITALRRRVEEVFGASLQTHNSFISLSEAVERALREHLSESTLERLWGYSTRESSAISLRTLDVRARYCGNAGWEAFKSGLKGKVESEEFATEGIAVDNLRIGDCIQLGWLPDRLVTIRLEVDGRFSVIDSVNSSLKPGDSFNCTIFQKDRPLYLDHFRRAGSDSESRYVAGERSGLTTLILL